MAQTCENCTCTPYGNICCCPSQQGITVSQPQCQIIPSGAVVGNPCYQASENKSYWTYKFMTNCDQATRGISGFVIPICETIPATIITVEEKIDGCGSFESVAFEVNKTFPNYGTAPEGYNYLKVETSDRYDKGVCVVYRLSIFGDFPVSSAPILVKTATSIFTFGCDGCYLVPQCPPNPRILVAKECSKTIVNNQVLLSYAVHVDNIGNTTLNNVFFEDTIAYSATNIVIGSITVTPTLSVDTSTPGIIKITGDLGNFAPGDNEQILIDVSILDIKAAGIYNIINNAKASSSGVEGSDSCILTIEAVRLRANKCCALGSTPSSWIFRLQISNAVNSPETDVTIGDVFVIPQGVTIRFTSFGGCTAVFADNQQLVPLNTDITNRTINVSCENVIVPSSGTATKEIAFQFVSTTAFVAPISIINAITDVIFLNTDTQILLGIDNVPSTAVMEIIANVQCLNPCD